MTWIWFFRARLCLACGHQYNRCAGLGEVAGGPPQRRRTETTPLEPRAISSEYETLFVKRCTKPLCLCRRHCRAKIALHAGPRRIQGDGRGVAFLIHVNGVMFTLTLAQHIIRRADVHGTQSVAGRVIGMSDSMYRKWMQAVAKTLQTATEKVNMAIYEISRLPAMLLMKRCTSTPSTPYSCIQRKCRSTVL